MLARYTIRRKGADLSSVTTVFLQSYTLPSDNATAGDDFFAGPLPQMVFQSGEELKTGVIEILPDNIREGKEVFHIHIKAHYNAQRGSPDVLEVVILDAFEGK